MFSDDLPWTDTSYDRDYEEEAANQRLMEEGDDEDLDVSPEADAALAAVIGVAALATFLISPDAPLIVRAIMKLVPRDV